MVIVFFFPFYNFFSILWADNTDSMIHEAFSSSVGHPFIDQFWWDCLFCLDSEPYITIPLETSSICDSRAPLYNVWYIMCVSMFEKDGHLWKFHHVQFLSICRCRHVLIFDDRSRLCWASFPWPSAWPSWSHLLLDQHSPASHCVFVLNNSR